MRRFVITLIALATLFTFVIGALQWHKWQSFGYNGLDVGIYTQTIWSLSQGHGFANSIHDPTYRGDHLELILAPLGAIYRLIPHPLSFLWFQTLCLAWSGVLIGALARRLVSTGPAILAAALWLAHPFIYNPAMYEFHALTLALPFLLSAVFAYERRQWGAWLIWLTLACLIREDIPLIAISWAVLGGIDRIPKRWWISAGLVGIVWFGLSHLLIMTANSLHDYKYTAFIGWIGQTPTEMLTFPFRHPFIFLQHVFAPNNWGITIGLLIGFGFLPLLRAKYLIPAGLSFAQMLLIGSSPTSVLHLHYVIPFIPFLAWATIHAVRDNRATALIPRFDPAIVRAFVVILAICGPLYLQAVYGPLEAPWTARPDTDQTPAATLREVVRQVKPEESVITTFNLLPALSNRTHVYSLNYVYLGRRQYTETRYVLPGPIDVAVIDWKHLYESQYFYDAATFEGKTGSERIRQMLADNQLAPAYWRGSVVVYRHQGIIEAPLSVLQTNQVATGDDLTADMPIATVVDHQVELRLNWQVASVPTKPVSIRLTVTGRDGRRVGTTRLVGEGAWPATEWQAGQVWTTTYRVELPTDFTPTSIEYSWVNLDGAYRLDRLRSFRPRVTNVIDLGHGSTPISS